MKARGSFGRPLAWALVLDGVAAACGGDTTSPSTAALTGGTGGTATGGQQPTDGGSAAGGQQSMGGAAGAANPCDHVADCGGDLVGTWGVQSSCLEFNGMLDLSQMGIGCLEAPITGGSLQVTGTWTANRDGTYADNTTTTGSEQFTLAASCLMAGEPTTCVRIGQALGVSLGFASCTCTDTTGYGCDCSGIVEQAAGMGTVNGYPSPSGSYTTSANVLLINDGTKDWPYSYCVSANRLTMTPQPTGGPAAAGTIVLERQ